MPALMKKQVPEQVVTLLQTLNAEQLGEVILFMEFLKAKETQSSPEAPMWLSITREADARVTLEQVRTRLRAIPGNLSDVIIQERDEKFCRIIERERFTA